MLAPEKKSLIYRFYLPFISGLFLLFILSDLSFYWLLKQQEPSHYWINNQFKLIELHLSDSSSNTQTINTLENTLNAKISLIDSDAVTFAQSENQDFYESVEDGNSSFFYYSQPLNRIISYSPEMNVSSSSLLPTLLSYLFYLGLLIFLATWLRPIIKELNLLSIDAQRFAKDYRYVPAKDHQFKKTKELANSFASMALQIQALIQNQKSLTNALSHELRTPLARIKFILAMIDGNSNIEEDTGYIKEEIGQLEEIISTMLDYAKLDYLDNPLQTEWVPANVWIHSVFDRFKHPDIQLQLNVQLTDDRQFFLDPRLMELALSNLINNALKYAKNKVQLTVIEEKSVIEFFIADDGNGIHSSHADYVFEPFSRLDTSRDRKTGGFGLGLSIVKRIIQLHNADVLLLSASPYKLGSGACFKIALPRH